ncbi:hypothetical protein DL132_01790 [Salmonella enterica subsp. enterica serovar Typhimurium]|nr:hypothetical protein [Salmonella enterica subsp. enterica serovar Typhimurium str. UK-1]EBU8743464.1 hypothetical protein [Salmonella enterica subsp. enterica serovar Typhimurium]EBX0657327.1 hypothetical protein [Salmonella enterica subsp. enterica serovar Typhimurium]EBY9286588.1 hypothetical protein [Salmonella enterica subsp. enterica serovar Typhimurium]ECS6912666.1 hypothetical protein [Salmonella enterica subsp. enterica serovar Typhimurium]
MSQNLFFVLCAAHDDANAILRRKPLISVVPPFISIYTKSFELHQGGNSAGAYISKSLGGALTANTEVA